MEEGGVLYSDSPKRFAAGRRFRVRKRFQRFPPSLKSDADQPAPRRYWIVGGNGAVAIFTTQCAIASVWLRHFHFGPIEWVWRRFTYGAPIALVCGRARKASRLSA
ncbi:MAG: DUF418 domain-containing protein [Proteobacteria bacterium]|nr:DUF418 domain-containing protein [Pseudomonadota bacterium]